MYYEEFSEIINRYLTQIDRSGSWAAQRLGVSRTTINRWRNGESRPQTLEMINRLADILGIYGHERERFLYTAGYVVLNLEATSSNDAMVIDDSSDIVLKGSVITKKNIEDVSKLFGETLSSVINTHGISQQYLANRMEISPAAVSQWRTGKRVPDIATLHLIRQTLDLEQYELEKLLEAWLTTRISSDLLIYLNIHKDEAYHLETINNVLNKLWLKEFFAIDY